MLVAAHGNSLRALVAHLDGIAPADLAGLNVPTGVPLVYELEEGTLKPRPHPQAFAPLGGRYLGDLAEVRARIDGVKVRHDDDDDDDDDDVDDMIISIHFI